ncbi:MAG: hypothetical protein M3Y84_02490 [Acidobacteriota bacterium]|nr:hypothetical protein [Acidobacteriota bacterium]
MDIDSGLEYVLAGETVLFIGAGFSTGAKNLRNSPLKTGGGLAKYLSAEVKLPESTSLEDASEEFALQRGDAALITELQQEFTAARGERRAG